MALKLTYYGQNDTTTTPDVVLTGDPGTDQTTLTNAGFLGGKIMAIQTPSLATGVEFAIVPCNSESQIPYGVLLNGPGEFSGAIGPSGSKKAPIVRALFQGNVNNEAYDTGASFAIGAYVYCGGATNSVSGFYTTKARLSGGNTSSPVGICNHVPSTPEPWLGVASLI